MHRSSLRSRFPATGFIEEYKEPKIYTTISHTLTVLAVNYCAAITSYEDTLDAMEEHLLTCIISPTLTSECMYLCCFVNNIEYFKSFYENNTNSKNKKQLNILRQWHPNIFAYMEGFLEEQSYFIETFLKGIESDYLNFNKLVSDMELIDPESKQKLAFLYVHNEKNYALGATFSSHIVTQVFQFFHEQRNTFMEQNATQWAFLGKVNRSREFWTYLCPMGLEFSFLSLEDIDPTLASHIEEIDQTRPSSLFRHEYNLKNYLGDFEN